MLSVLSMFPVVSTSLILGDHEWWWLESTCACGQCAQLSIKMLLREWRRETEIGQLARRLRCRQCGTKPAATALVEDIQIGAKGTGTASGRGGQGIDMLGPLPRPHPPRRCRGPGGD